MRYQTKAYKALFLLLQAGLWERKPKDISIFPLTQAEWNSVFVLAQQQTVLGITYRGLDYLPEYLFPSQELLIRWVAEIDRIEQRNLESNQSLIELVKLFSSHGLKPILQKGQGVATFYDRPLLRTCGDIDLWFPTREERLEAVRLIKEQGIAVHTAADRSNHYMWHSIEVEHHRYLLDLQSPFAKGWGRRMVLKMQPTTLTLVEHTDTAILTPSPEINLLLLNAHICKHAIGLGIGLRQICDIARAYLTLHDRVDGEEIRALYHRAGLKRWIENYCPTRSRHARIPSRSWRWSCAEATSGSTPRIVKRSWGRSGSANCTQRAALSRTAASRSATPPWRPCGPYGSSRKGNSDEQDPLPHRQLRDRGNPPRWMRRNDLAA